MSIEVSIGTALTTDVIVVLEMRDSSDGGSLKMVGITNNGELKPLSDGSPDAVRDEPDLVS